MGEVQARAGCWLFVGGARVSQYEESAEQVFVEFFFEAKAGVTIDGEGYIFEGYALGLVDLLHAVDEWAALDGYAAVIFDDLGVGFEDLRGHVELQGYGVAG